MPDFLAQSIIETDIGTCELLVLDESIYGANGEPSHDRALFSDFRLIEVTRELDGVKYIYATLAALTGSTDQTIDPPSANTGESWTLPTSFTSVNGAYSMLLITVPTWNSGVAYNPLSTVYYGGSFYRTDGAILAAQDAPDENGDWVAVSLDDLRTEAEYTEYRSTDNTTLSCLIQNTEYFEATLQTTGNVDNIYINQNGTTVIVTDHTNYFTNDENGHLDQFFTYRILQVTKPGGGVWTMSSIAGQNQLITAPSTGNMVMQYTFQTNDVDGVYGIQLISIPTWGENVYYNSQTASQSVIVYHNLKRWILVTTNIGVEPGTYTAYWVEFTGDIANTRYCYTTNIVVLELNVDKAINNAILAGAKMISDNPCNNNFLCNNPKFLTAMKLIMLRESIEINSCFRRYELVQNDFDAINKIICHGC